MRVFFIQVFFFPVGVENSELFEHSQCVCVWAREKQGKKESFRTNIEKRNGPFDCCKVIKVACRPPRQNHCEFNVRNKIKMMIADTF